MKISLPKSNIIREPQFLECDNCHRFIIIGANGAGKTRFTTDIISSLGDKAYCVSALDALYNTSNDSDKNVRPSFKNTAAVTVSAPQDKPTTEMELLLTKLMHDEMLNLIGYKLALADNRTDAHLLATKLDRVIALWQEVFPTNKILIESGKILFSKGLEHDTYSAVRLSAGERAVLYYASTLLYAPEEAVIFVDSPEMFLHPTLTTSLWNRLELLRPDCTFCYTTHDPEFASSRSDAPIVWVRDYNNTTHAWDYDILPPQTGISNELYVTLIGARKPVLFIEGDAVRSIDAKLYPLIFPDFTVRSLGSCNKVIEATRTFNDLESFHKMDSFGIVDRDRRNDNEVAYLRRKRIMVPNVAEVENILMLEDVIKAMASHCDKDPERVFSKVKRTIIAVFKSELRQQALMHTRHMVKRTMEYRVDARFSDIGTLEKHLEGLLDEISPRKTYENFCREFHEYVASGDYANILRVYNQKSMLSSSNVAALCGYKNKDEYINNIIALLKTKQPEAEQIRNAVKRCLGIDLAKQDSESLINLGDFMDTNT